ncbi:Hypothetical protein FNO222_0871 [Francisella orientalis]|uniref:Uncharacterized protein n=1 Tax=Francisella orientalis TaxID=299583 RepID=A0ABM5U5U0_9GAMM|nr:hypothetical protein FNO12_0867 [Francisella orientalis FNO12]AKN87082.1 Hypothetical protein FNO24_0867 [Francisella orientalis FNO24]AKN88620.1 Hypothetical protein FNO190_0867 [Francisella orientalis]AKU05377.1 Hypothetical protein FNO01_0867 [Francisella orientalis]QEN20286.1 Hypothetical protein FNO39_0871 [Francisella orientalis]
MIIAQLIGMIRMNQERRAKVVYQSIKVTKSKRM